MSRRFGRNQRRRAREALAAAQADTARMTRAYDMAKGLAQHLGERKRALEDELNEAKDIAGRLSVLFPATEFHQGGDPSRARQAARDIGLAVDVPELVRERMSVVDSLPLEAYDTFRRQRLPVLLSEVRPDAMNLAVHARITFADKTSGYAISALSLQAMSRREIEERVFHVIAPDLARHITAQLKGKKP